MLRLDSSLASQASDSSFNLRLRALAESRHNDYFLERNLWPGADSLFRFWAGADAEHLIWRAPPNQPRH